MKIVKRIMIMKMMISGKKKNSLKNQKNQKFDITVI